MNTKHTPGPLVVGMLNSVALLILDPEVRRKDLAKELKKAAQQLVDEGL